MNMKKYSDPTVHIHLNLNFEYENFIWNGSDSTVQIQRFWIWKCFYVDHQGLDAFLYSALNTFYRGIVFSRAWRDRTESIAPQTSCWILLKSFTRQNCAMHCNILSLTLTLKCADASWCKYSLFGGPIKRHRILANGNCPVLWANMVTKGMVMSTLWGSNSPRGLGWSLSRFRFRFSPKKGGWT